MLLYLFGADSYRRTKKQREIVTNFKAKQKNGKLAYFDLSQNGNFSKLEDFISDTSLFSKKTLAIVEMLEKAPPGITKFLKKYQEALDTTLIVNAEKKLPAKFSFLSQKPNISQKFENLSNEQLEIVIKKEAEERDYELEKEEARELIAVFGNDLWVITSEIEKRSLGQKGSLVSKQRLDFFPAINALRGSMERGRKLKILDQLLKDEEPSAVFNLLAALSSPEMKTKMADYDIAIKSGKLDYPEILLNLVLS